MFRDSSQEGERAVIEPSPQPSRQRAESTAKMSAHVARSHGGDGGGDDRPPSHVAEVTKAQFGRRQRAANTRDKTRNLSLKDTAGTKGPVPITFEVGDKQTLNPLGPHAANWSNYIGEVVRSTLFDLRPHRESDRWTEIYEGINQHLQKAYNTNKATFKARHWKADPTTGTYDVEGIRRARPEEITAAEWDKDPGPGIDFDEMEEMRRLEATGQHTEDEINALARGGKLRGHIPGVGRVLPSRATSRPSMPATDKSLQNVNRKVDFMMSIFRSDSRYSDMFREFESGGASGSGGRDDDEEGGNDEDGEDEDDDAIVRWGLSLGKESLTKLPQRRFPSDMSLGKTFPSDMSLGKGSECRQGRRRML
ncbi:hypothetical protein Tco_0241265 [Tanacetum coccineum]